MRRLALLLAASVLGTGCIVSHDNTCTSTVSIGWPTFLLANGAQTPSCTAAGVSFVDVFMDDLPVGEFDCAQGGVSVLDVPSGTHRFTVEGLDAPAASGGVILLRDERIVTSSACGEQIVTSTPAEGTLVIDYSFASSNVCNPGSLMWFSVFDEIAGKVAAVADETANTTSFRCGIDAISFVLPAGAYTLDRIEEVTPTPPPNGPLVPTANNCSPTTFTVEPVTVTSVPVVLADSISNTLCPASVTTQTRTSRAAVSSESGTAKALAPLAK
jgi:hypothetical protein